MRTKLGLSVELLVDGYVNQGKSSYKLALKYGVSETTIRRYLKDNGVQIRNRSEAGTLVQGGNLNGNWQGGRYKQYGYVFVWLPPDDPFYPMANRRGYIREHRLVMALHLGRCLESWEIVHHKDGVKDHNNYSNLELTSDGKHKQVTTLENRIKWLEERVLRLEVENVLLSKGLESVRTSEVKKLEGGRL